MENQTEKTTKSGKKRGKTNDKAADASRKTWNQKEEDALVNALKEMVIKGDKILKDCFKSGYLSKLEGMLLLALPDTEIRAYPHIASKLKVWKKNYHSVKEMRNKTGCGWNESSTMVVFERERDWENYCKVDNNAKGLRFKLFPYYDDWCLIFGDDRATGDMAESAADVAKEVFGVDPEEVDGSTTMNKNDKSPQEPAKKKKKISEVLMTGLADFGDKITSSFEKSASKLDMIGSRMGYQHDLSAKRSAVNEALEKLPITPTERVLAAMAICQEAQKVDLFFSLKTDDDKMIMVKALCPS